MKFSLTSFWQRLNTKASIFKVTPIVVDALVCPNPHVKDGPSDHGWVWSNVKWGPLEHKSLKSVFSGTPCIWVPDIFLCEICSLEKASFYLVEQWTQFLMWCVSWIGIRVKRHKWSLMRHDHHRNDLFTNWALTGQWTHMTLSSSITTLIYSTGQHLQKKYSFTNTEFWKDTFVRYSFPCQQWVSDT